MTTKQAKNTNANKAISGIAGITGWGKMASKIAALAHSRKTTEQQNRHHFRITKACVTSDHKVKGSKSKENHHKGGSQPSHKGAIATQSSIVPKKAAPNSAKETKPQSFEYLESVTLLQSTY